MPGFLLTVDSSINRNGTTTHDIRQQVYPVKQLNGPHSMALVSINTYASWHNVSAAIGNNVFTYVNTALAARTVTIPDGVYSAATLFAEIYAGMKDNTDYTVELGSDVFSIVFDSRIADNRATIEISDGFKASFNLCTGLAATLGFAPTLVSASKDAEYEMDIFNGLQELQLHTDLCEGSIENGSPSETIGTFQANQFAPNEAISVVPGELLFIPLRSQQSISQYRFWLTDQHNTPIDLQGAALSITCFVKRDE